jgi:thiol-disulfide isomerase/thioredoxin
MSKTLRLLLLLFIAAPLNVASQSGRRITTPAPIQPIQPSKTTEPELPPPPPAALGYLPETILDRQIKSFDKGTFRLADFQGKILVINVWASWCGPCRREVPEYEKVRKAYVDRDVEFIGLTAEDPRTASDRVDRFLREIHFGFRLGWMDRQMERTLMNGRNAIPQTLVIDVDGSVVSHWTGYAAGQSGNRLKETIERALDRHNNK